MTKLLWLLVLACVACRLLFKKWPWQFLSGASDRADEIARARQLLDVPANADRQAILDAHRKLLTAVHPDRGGTSERVHEANDARDTLLRNLPPESRGS